MFTIGAFGIIVDEKKRVLLCHRRDYDLWNLPGGKVEANETPWDAVIREIKEETGLDAKITHLAGVYSKPDKNEIVFSFICEITGGEITLTDEADIIEYFSADQIPKNTSPKQVERIKDYFADQFKTHYKVQTGASSIDLAKAGKL
ncbi:MAG: NUDIX hydrolase [Patescibacteria group bacterium]|jgi:mutator protein MutT